MSIEPTETETTERKTYPASVAEVYNKYRLVINRGTIDGVDIGQRFLVYRLSDEEIHDPTTGDSLGRLEIPKGTGEVIVAQHRMATIESDEYPPSHRTIKRGGYSLVEEEFITPSKRPKPFHDPKVGDFVKPVY